MAQNYYNIPAYTRSQPEARLGNPPIIAKRNPGNNDKWQISQEWINVTTNAVFILTSFVGGIPTWTDITGAGGAFTSLTVTPGPISLTGTTSINTTGAATTSIGTGTNSGITTIGNTATVGSGIALNVGSSDLIITGAGNIISIGADAAANTILVGSLTNGSTTTISGGNNTGVGPGAAAINLETAPAGDIQIGLPSQTGTVQIAPSTVAHIVNISNGVNTGAAVVNISAGAAGANSTVNILSGNATAGVQTLNALTGTRAGAVNIGSGAAANVITIGSSTVGNVTNLASPITSLPRPVFIYTGAGAPSNGLALHVGDLYINTTAASATTRIYLASAVGTWVNFTMSA